MEIPSEILVALLSFLGTLVGSFGGMKLMKYQIEQLSKRVDKHNQVIDRVYALERHNEVQDEKIKNLEKEVESNEN